jgi:hypothetical protein
VGMEKANRVSKSIRFISLSLNSPDQASASRLSVP